jgi:glycosyltransferase involved in cell wall biosynthesis
MLSSMTNPDDILIESYTAQSSSLRIAIVTETFPPEINGVAMTLGRIVAGLIQRGHSVQLIRPRQVGELNANAQASLDEVLCRGIQVPTYRELRFGLPMKNRLTKLWQNKRPDIVHVATEGPLGWSAVAAARKLHLPVTSSFHTNFHRYSQHYGIGLLKTPIEAYLRKLHNRTEATMVPTKVLVRELQQRGFKNVKLLSRGVATELFTPEKRSETLRESWGARHDDVVVLLVGRLAKEKNVGLVIAAYQSIKQKVPSAKLVFVGDGPLRKQLEKAVPEAIFSGIRKGEELAAHYASGDLFLFASLTETFGNVVSEALASGLAVLSYNIAGAQELITTERNGVLVAENDELEFIRASIALASNAQLQQKIRQAARPSVEHLGWDTIFNNFLEILSDVLRRHDSQFANTALPSSDNVVSHSNT